MWNRANDAASAKMEKWKKKEVKNRRLTYKFTIA